MLTFAIVRSTHAKAVPFEIKILVYVSCILVVAFQWIADSAGLYMYLIFDTAQSFVKNTELVSSLWIIFQIASWVMQGCCLVAIMTSMGRQLAHACYKKNY